MIIRVAERDRFVQILNDTIRDERLSWKARGLLAYLLSMPDNWRANIRDLTKRGPDGKASVQTGLTELEEAGYVTRSKIRLDDGTFDYVCDVHERPVSENRTSTENPDADSPDADNRDVRTTHPQEPPIEESVASDAPSSPRKSRARSSPEADAITREWWEEHEPRPMQQFVAVRQIVQKALTAGYTREEVLEGLRRIRGAPPVTTWKLEQAVTAARGRHDAKEATPGDGEPSWGLNDRMAHRESMR